jgi:serine/threonine protein kinase/tetratricopeptide (TPR) repeat protein
MNRSQDHEAPESRPASLGAGATKKLNTFPLQDFAKPPEHIGPYRILETLGEGGMGVVYLAQQTEPVERKVALKVIKLGMDTKEVVARFESERQALALMDHPNIARILEGGVTDEGRPFFVMEHVPGESITEYCDRHKLSTRERLALFEQVCRGVQHAHQKGIIHRDLKPTNIQVMLQDGKPVPKVIDFGVAKATNRRLTEKTLYTEQGQLIGTPAYMSPEQAEMTGLNVDTTTDIYSLGVLLYELLVGVLPFDQKTLRSKSLDEVHRLIREVDPPRPSTRLSGIGEDATAIALQRRTDVSRLRGQLKGELDWIILKAMEKDRTRRYSSASELAADIERYLKHQPILAHAPSTTYQLRKMVRRHTTAVGFAATVLVLIIGFGVWMSFLYTRAVRAEDAAASEAETATQVSDFMVEMFEVVDPSQALGETITAKEILDQGAEKIERDLTDQPLIQARLMDTMGQVYGSLGLLQKSESLLESALEVREAELDSYDLEIANSLTNIGDLYISGRRFQEAIDPLERALAIRERHLGPLHIDTAWSKYYLGQARAWLIEGDRARSLLRQALAVFEKELGPNTRAAAWCFNDLALSYGVEGNNEEAVPLFRRSLEIKEKCLDPKDPDIALGLNNLNYTLVRLGRYEEAEPVLRRGLKIQEQVLPVEHVRLAVTLHSLGEVVRNLGRSVEAESLLTRALEIQERGFGSDNPEMALTLTSLGALYRDTDRYEESQRTFKRAIAAFEDTVGPDYPDLAKSLDEYAQLMEKLGRDPEARQLRERAKSIRVKNESGRGDS